MATIVVFTIPNIGHVYPTLPIVAELVRRGERVVYYCDVAFQERIEATGAEFRPVPWNFDAVMADPRLVALAAESLRCTESWMPQLLAEVRQEAPDALLVDFMCVWGRFVARTLSLPMALMTSSFALGPGILPPDLVITAMDMGLSLERARMIREIRQRSARLTQRYGVAQLRTPVDLLSMDGDIVMASTSRLFQPRAELFGDHVHFVGPCIAPRDDDSASALPPLDDRPLVYISLGTVFNRNVGFFKQCVQAFADGAYQVIMAVGREGTREALGVLPEHIHAVAYAPQLTLLKRAAVFVSHAGMNSTSEAITNGVPLVLAPQAADQFAIAGRLQALGAGIFLRPWQRSARHIRRAVERAHTDASVREQGQLLQRSFQEAGGPQRAADILQAFLRRNARPISQPEPALNFAE